MVIILIGPLPPPANGQSVSFQLLLEGVKERGLDHVVIDINSKPTGFWRRAYEYFLILRHFFVSAAFGRKTVYITIAQSLRGFVRDFLIIWYSRLFGHRVICHLHGGNYGNFYAAQAKCVKWLIRMTLGQANDIIILGEGLRSMFSFDEQLGPKLRVVPNGIPMASIPRGVVKTLPTSPTQPIRLLYLSNLIESKGYFDVLDAVRILTKVYHLNVTCEFCGLFVTNPADDVRVKSVTQARELFEGFVQEHKLEAHVVYRGPVEGADKVEALRRAHFFVLPTNYSNEGQPVSIIEAMAFGCVVISTNYRAIPDLVVNGETGFLIPYGHPEAIAEVVRLLVKDPAKYQAMSRAARDRFDTYFTREAHLDRMLEILSGQ